MSLREKGWRFVYRPVSGWAWTHPEDIREGDVDGTDMSDEEFKSIVVASAPDAGNFAGVSDEATEDDLRAEDWFHDSDMGAR